MADTTVFHPTIPDISRQVPEAEVEKWAKQGWLKSEPTSAAVKDTRAATEKARKADLKAFSTAAQVTPGVSDVPAIDPGVHTAPEK